MKIDMIASKPGEIELMLTATMTLQEWAEIRKEVSKSTRSPVWEFHKAIADIIDKAEKRFDCAEFS